MKINVLEPRVYNRISAGEVVERPASIVKELVENSIDAGAKNIRIEIEGGGIKNVTVTDDGSGIEKEDLTVAFLPHATSKIKKAEDLDSIASLGFRGEALASIASVCQVKLSSKTADSAVGYSLKVEGGEFSEIVEIAHSKGTSISCSNLFYNTPVRAKFLRKPKSEEAEITHLVERLMLSFSNIAFQYIVDGKTVYNTSSCSMSDIIYTIYGNEIYESLIEVYYEERGFLVKGYITKPKVSKSNRTYQTLFVNNRYVENLLISTCVSNVYSSFLMKGRFPVYVLSLNVPVNNVDVNVHPSKKEVRFDNPQLIYGIVTRAIENAMLSSNQIQSFILPKSEDMQDSLEKEEKPFSLPNLKEHKTFVEEIKDPSFGGRSFDVDKKEIINETPKEIEIESSTNKVSDKNQDLKDLENLSIKDTIDSKRNNSTFFFDQSGEKFSREIENEINNFLSASVKEQMKILGTVFKTYIVVECFDAVYFIDQHAAHERLLYDKLVESIDKNNDAKQQLLAPYSFSVGAKESQSLELILPSLEKLGFEIMQQGYNYTIMSVPYLLSYLDLAQFVDEIIAFGADLENKASDFVHSKLCQSACKHAIKAGDSITPDECAYILEEVKKGVMLCPHGRPITLVFTKHDFEKMFKRIV